MNSKTRIRRELFKMAALSMAGAGLTGTGLLAYAAGVEPKWVEVKHVTLPLRRLDKEFHGYRIVQISDIHAGKWMPTALLEEVVRLINAQSPDLVAVTGDFVTYTYHEAPLDIVPSMHKLRARDGVVAVLGNHDYWGNQGPDLIRHVIRDSGMIDLNNNVHTFERDGKLLHLAGVDSARERMSRLDMVLDGLPGEGAAVLLAHEPDFADVSARSGRFDLQISGHSHGGQVVVPFLGPPELPPMGRKYHTGTYQVRDMLQYTNRGLGVVGVPFRFCCRPEITVITLEARSSTQ
jgi:predicted MPP superfamily phosphohydrolase